MIIFFQFQVANIFGFANVNTKRAKSYEFVLVSVITGAWPNA